MHRNPVVARHVPARRRFRPLVAVIMAAFAMGACADGTLRAPLSPDGPSSLLNAPPGSVVVVPDVFCPLSHCTLVPAGDSIHYKAFMVEEDGTARELLHPIWRVADTTIASVSPTGWLRGRAPGESRLIAMIGTASGETAIAVRDARITEIRIAPVPALAVGGTVKLEVTLIDVLGRERPDEPVVWFSHNSMIGTVDKAGVLTGVSDGHVIVSAYGPDNSGGWVSVQIGSGASSTTGMALSQVSVGATHACGVAAGGAAYCWGWNYYGQLGVGFPSPENETFGTPLRVRSRAALQKVSAGSFHTCALAADNTAWCWGANIWGEGGTGKPGGINVVPAPVHGGGAYADISAGGDHTCALEPSGRAVCWGANPFGQLGNGTTDSAAVPEAVPGLAGLTAIRSGLWHTCALDAGGSAYCWGDDSFGQIGNGRLGGGIQPVATSVRTRMRFTTLETSAAASHTCGLTSAGEIYCWGRNDSGQLGDGTRESRSAPVRVASSLRFTAVAVSAHHTCAVADDGAAHCWGNNEYGQLGDLTLHSRNTPGPVATPMRFVSLSSTNNVTCGRTASASTYCWGSNHHGTLGAGYTGAETMSAYPIPLAEPATR